MIGGKLERRGYRGQEEERESLCEEGGRKVYRERRGLERQRREGGREPYEEHTGKEGRGRGILRIK